MLCLTLFCSLSLLAFQSLFAFESLFLLLHCLCCRLRTLFLETITAEQLGVWSLADPVKLIVRRAMSLLLPVSACQSSLARLEPGLQVGVGLEIPDQIQEEPGYEVSTWTATWCRRLRQYNGGGKTETASTYRRCHGIFWTPSPPFLLSELNYTPFLPSFCSNLTK